MRKLSMFLRILVLLALALGLAACSSGEQAELLPSIGVYEAGASSRGDAAATTPGFCEQNCGADLGGAAFRFTILHVTEPADETSPMAKVVRDIINDSWSSDILTHVLNLIIEVDPPDYAGGQLQIHAGPAWFRLTDEAAANPPGLGDVVDEDIDRFCLLEALDGQAMDIAIDAPLDENCGFEIDLTADDGEGSFLMFHTGPTSEPVLCAPEQALSEGLVNNTIPLSVTYVRGRFDEGCGAIVDGYLEGCIALEHAYRICICIDGDYDCYANGDPGSDTYCGQHCGEQFLNFGGIVADVAQIPTTCQVLGLDGIRIAGDFEAVRLAAERFSAERSIDCIQ